MKLKEYQEKAKRTMADLGSDKLNLSHMVMGMCTELVELSQSMSVLGTDIVNTGEELADIQWYIANYRTLRNQEYQPATGFVSNPKTRIMYDTVALLQDIIKKYIAYNKPIDFDEEQRLLNELQCNIDGIYNGLNLSQEEYLQKNIDKLQARYPEKFTEYDAVNRDLDKERKILES